MDLLSDGARAAAYLAESGFRHSRTLGQNFLLDDGVNRAIAEAGGAGPGMNVLEIGPGAGTLTCALARAGARVLAVEIDDQLRPVLEKMLAGMGNVQVVYGDIMKQDIPSLADGCFGAGAGYSVISNLPYAIASELLPDLVSGKRPPESITALVQAEAAERMASSPGEKTWCATAAKLKHFCRIQRLMTLPPHLFTPNAHVDSTLIRLDRLKESEREAQPKDLAVFLRCIDAAFAMRRKTLVNNLAAAFPISKAQAAQLLKDTGLADTVRGEALTLRELGLVSDAVAKAVREG